MAAGDPGSFRFYRGFRVLLPALAAWGRVPFSAVVLTLVFACDAELPIRAVTVGEACDRVLNASCHRAVWCLNGTFNDQMACVDAGVPNCCGLARTCQLTVRNAQEVSQCVSATESESCDGWQRWAASPNTVTVPLPTVCVGVARPE